MATPLFFGDSKRPLYGVHQAPLTGGRSRAVVLCNPFGEEAIRAFRIYRLIAERLAAAGVSVLRFDYAATGDSAGACEAASLAGFAESIALAQEEIVDISGARDCIFIGLRLGASAAVIAATTTSARPSALVLWDPVVSGTDYLKELSEGHARAIETQIGSRPAITDPPSEALGFAVPETLGDELKALDLLRTTRAPARRVAIVAGPRTDRRLGETLLRLGAETVWRDDPGDASWNSDDALNSFAVPAKTLEIIVAETLA